MKIFTWISIFLIATTLIVLMSGCRNKAEPHSREDKEDEYPRSPLPGFWHTVGLKSDGTVVVTGANSAGQLNVNDWTDIIQISAGNVSTVGLKSNGTVVAVGWNYSGQLDVGNWMDIICVDASSETTIGLTSDGTVITTRLAEQLAEFTDIIQIDGIVGLKSDGTVVIVENEYKEWNVGDWTNIIQVVTGGLHVVGLKSDGTVVAEGGKPRQGLDPQLDDWQRNDHGQLNVSDWTDIIQISAGEAHTVGLKSDGTVVAVGHNVFGQLDVNEWKNIIQIAAGPYHTVGLKSDGTVIAVGYNEAGECEVEGWTDIIQISAASSR